MKKLIVVKAGKTFGTGHLVPDQTGCLRSLVSTLGRLMADKGIETSIILSGVSVRERESTAILSLLSTEDPVSAKSLRKSP